MNLAHLSKPRPPELVAPPEPVANDSRLLPWHQLVEQVGPEMRQPRPETAGRPARAKRNAFEIGRPHWTTSFALQPILAGKPDRFGAFFKIT